MSSGVISEPAAHAGDTDERAHAEAEEDDRRVHEEAG
jgi:hypothetical protein